MGIWEATFAKTATALQFFLEIDDWTTLGGGGRG